MITEKIEATTTRLGRSVQPPDFEIETGEISQQPGRRCAKPADAARIHQPGHGTDHVAAVDDSLGPGLLGGSHRRRQHGGTVMAVGNDADFHRVRVMTVKFTVDPRFRK